MDINALSSEDVSSLLLDEWEDNTSRRVTIAEEHMSGLELGAGAKPGRTTRSENNSRADPESEEGQDPNVSAHFVELLANKDAEIKRLQLELKWKNEVDSKQYNASKQKNATRERDSQATWELKQKLKATQIKFEGMEHRLTQATQEATGWKRALKKQKVHFQRKVRSLEDKHRQTSEKHTEAEARLHNERALVDTAKARVKKLKSSEQKLRDLVQRLLLEKDTKNLKTKRKKEFWDHLATPEVLAESRPPADFALPKQSEQFSQARFDKLKAEIDEQNREIKQLHAREETLSAENHQLRTLKNKEFKTLQQEHSRQKTQLSGAVRRIHWLLYEKEKVEEELKSTKLYRDTLEKKVLSQNDEVLRLKRLLGESHQTRPVCKQSNKAKRWWFKPKREDKWEPYIRSKRSTSSSPVASPTPSIPNSLDGSPFDTLSDTFEMPRPCTAPPVMRH